MDRDNNTNTVAVIKRPSGILVYTSRCRKDLVLMNTARLRKSLGDNLALILIDRPIRQALNLDHPLLADRLLTGRKPRRTHVSFITNMWLGPAHLLIGIRMLQRF